MSYSIISIDHSIKLAITASIKRFEFKRYDVDNDQLVDALLTDLFTDLFPHDPSLVSPDFTPTVQLPVILPTTTTTTTTTTKEKKKPGPKPKVAPIPEQPVEVVSSTPAPAPEKKKPGPKKSKVEQPEEVVLPTPEPASEKKKPGPKPKPKKVKFTKQHLNAMKEAEVEPEAFTTYINTIDPEAFDANNMFTYLEDFIRSTKKPKDESEEGYPDMQCVEFEFNGKTYFVNPDTRVVYHQANDEHVNVKVGIVGALEFADMELPSNV